MQDFDYIVVGAGAAGCVIASRLSERPNIRVLLIEAGRRDANPLISIPLGTGQILRRRVHAWDYRSEPEPSVNGRQLDAIRGKVLGGSSSINMMAYTRGNPADYDRWARQGAAGWSYNEVLPYFRRSETWTGPGAGWRGNSGPLGTEYARTEDPIFVAWTRSAQNLGYPVVDDYNGPTQEGFGRSQFAIRNGRRSSSASAYLRPALHRKNLLLETNALARKILFDGDRAVGIEYQQHGKHHVAHAAGEVILAAGAFNTPQLLLLSGIGSADHLREMGITPRIDLPVGEGLQEHFGCWILYDRKAPGRFHRQMRLDRMMAGLLQAYLFGTGAATIVPSGIHAFIKSNSGQVVPDIEFMFHTVPPDAHVWFPGFASYRDGYGINATLLHPKSRGCIRLRSSDPNDPVKIHFNALSDSDDVRLMREGIKRARELGQQAPLDPFRGIEIQPGPGIQTDDEIDAFVRQTGATAYHSVGTCRMGSDERSVCDPKLQVRGLEGLRVCDASVMPDLISGHINAAVVMMAEKTSDFILSNRCP